MNQQAGKKIETIRTDMVNVDSDDDDAGAINKWMQINAETDVNVFHQIKQ